MQTPNLVIRPFDEATDIEPLSTIWFDASLEAHPFMGRTRLLAQRKLIEEHYLPNSETWVDCRDGVPIGFISLLGTFIGGIFVAPRHQGQGVGGRLMQLAMERTDQLSLKVYTHNEKALRFYTSLGFSEVSRRQIDDLGLPFENARLEWTA